MLRKLFLVSLLFLTLQATAANGVASWYGGKFQGKTMANGQPFDKNKFTVANKTLPFGSVVRLCMKKCVEVTVTDRGPFIEGRDFDLAEAPAKELGLLPLGVGKVRWTLVKRPATSALHPHQPGKDTTR